MKKCLPILLALLLAAHAAAESVYPLRYTMRTVFPVYFSGETTFRLSEQAEYITLDDLASALEAAEETNLSPARLTILDQRHVSSDTHPIQVTFKAWGTKNCTLCIFFREPDSPWELLGIFPGDLPEPEFPADGEYALALAW